MIAYGSAISGKYINFAIHPQAFGKLQLYKVFKIRRTASSTDTTWIKCYSPDRGRFWRDCVPDDLPQFDENIPTGRE